MATMASTTATTIVTTINGNDEDNGNIDIRAVVDANSNIFFLK